MIKMTVLCMTIMSMPISYAALTIPGLSHQPLNAIATIDPTLAQTGLTVNDDDITPDQDSRTVQLTAQQLHEAHVWQLTPDEEKRYVLLMQNRSALYYRGLRQTPLDILGLNARTEDERNHFAELAAQQEAQKVTKNIAWNNAFHKAYNQLFGNVPVVGDFDPAPFSPYAHQPLVLQSGDVLYFFIKPDDSVKTLLLMLIDAIEQSTNTQLHLMLLDSDALTIQHWANQQQLPVSLVTSERMTLNQGDLNYEALTLAHKTTPLLLLAKNGHTHVVDLGRF